MSIFYYRFKDIFHPIMEYMLVNDTDGGRGQLGQLVDDPPDEMQPGSGNTTQTRRRRSFGYSRVCPAYVPSGTTELVVFADGSGSGQLLYVC